MSIRSAALLSVLVTLWNAGNAAGIPDRISLKAGVSYSLTQLDISPFSQLRRWYDRGIASPFLSVAYAIPLKRNELSAGLQLTEKGFKTSMHPTPLPDFEYEQYYEYLLQYVELPISYQYNADQYSFIMGAVVSYLYDDTYRFSETQILKARNPYKYNEISFATQYPHPERYEPWDIGINLGVSRKLTKSLRLELTYQKHFIRVDTRRSGDLAYNACVLLGLRYKMFAK